MRKKSKRLRALTASLFSVILVSSLISGHVYAENEENSIQENQVQEVIEDIEQTQVDKETQEEVESEQEVVQEAEEKADTDIQDDANLDNEVALMNENLPGSESENDIDNANNDEFNDDQNQDKQTDEGESTEPVTPIEEIQPSEEETNGNDTQENNTTGVSVTEPEIRADSEATVGEKKIYYKKNGSVPISISLSDYEDESGNCLVKQIDFYIDNDVQTLEVNNTNSKYTYNISEKGNHYLDKIEIVFVDKQIAPIVKNVDKIISIYDEEDDNNSIQAGFMDLDGYGESWYSTAARQANPHVHFKADTVRYIKKVTINKVTDVFGFLQVGETIGTFTNDNDVSLSGMNGLDIDIEFDGSAEGRYELVADVEYEVGSGYDKYGIEARIDNTAPHLSESDLNFTIVNENDGLMKEDTNTLYMKEPLKTSVVIPYNADSNYYNVESSGIYEVSFSVNGAIGETDPYVVPEESRNEEISISNTYAATESETPIEFVSVTLKDAAGNVSEPILVNCGKSIVFDSESPRIDFDNGYPKNSYDVGNGIRLFKGNAKGTLSITDFSLDPDTISITNVKGSKNPVIKVSGNSSENTRIYEYELNKEGTYKLKAEATDYALNQSSEESRIMVIDNSAPEITVSYSSNGKTFKPEGIEQTVKNGNVTIDVVMDEEYPAFEKCVLTVEGTDVNGNPYSETHSGSEWSGNLGEKRHMLSFTTPGDGQYTVTIMAEDLLGNKANVITAGFSVDSTRPEITLEFDNDDAVNGKYYNKKRVALITVTDQSFSEDDVDIDIDNQYGEPREGKWNGSGNIHTKEITFSQDGIYQMEVSCKDKAGNKSETLKEKEFVIDTTAPEISVSYDNNSPQNEIYYNTARTASIDIKEMSFEGDLVKVGTQPLANASAVPGIGTFSSDGDLSSANIVFSEDGTYGYTIECSDLAGNTSTIYTSDKFVIDTTEPEISFSGIENYSANNGTVAPIIGFIEKNVDNNLTEITISGANHGQVSRSSTVTMTEDGEQIAFSDFDHTKETDDLYTVNVKVKDLAGNEKEDKLVFSVNRFGSVYVLNDNAKALNEKYYTTEAKTVAITEINVDDLVTKDVMVGRDGDYYDLKEGKSMTISKEGNDESWKRYTYTINKSAFSKDGIYAIGISSVDRATNSQDSRSRDAAIDFALDKTKPQIVTPDLKDGTSYEGKNHKVNMNVTDNMAVKELKIYSDRKLIESFDQDSLLETAGTVAFNLEGDNKEHDIHVLAADVAGNTIEVIYKNIYVGDKKESTTTTIEEQNTATADGVDTNLDKGNGGDTNNIKRQLKNAVTYMILILMVMGLGACAGVMVIKKNKGQ